MPPRKSKKNAQQTVQTGPSAPAPAAVALTLEQIAAALVQLLEGQCQTQQQIEAVLVQQNNPSQQNYN